MGIAAERQPGSDWPKQSHDDHIKLASIADRRMWDQFNQQNLVYTFTGPNMTTSTKLWHANSVFFALSDNPWCFDQILAPLPEAMFDRCAPRMRYDTSKQGQHS